MSRDYKNSTSKKKPEGKGVPGWLWLVTGLMLGLLAAGLGYLGSHSLSSAKPVAKREEPRPEPPPKVEKKAEKKKEAAAKPQQPRFEFYTILPESEVEVPEQELAPQTRPGSAPLVKKPGTYILQSGSFKTQKQADQRKAQIVLLNLPVEVQSVTIGDEEWHRVIVGPFSELKPLNDAQARLTEEGIGFMRVQKRQ